MGGTILLADDSLTIQKVIELTFAETDFDVVAVSSGEELLARLPATKPNVIICDVIMPGKDGYDVCQEIKSNPAVLHIPVILLTGTFEPFDRDRALAAGCSEIITKPFEARRLVETVERLLRDTRAPASVQGRPTEPGAVVPPRYLGQVTPPPMAPSPMDFTGAVRPPATPTPAFAPPAPPLADLSDFGADEDDGNEFATRFTAPMSAVAAPAPPAAVVFGEAVAAGDDALDFTSTGFAEMKAAAERASEAMPPIPDDGLDYDAPAPAVGLWDTPYADDVPLGAVDRDTGPIPSLASLQDDTEYVVTPEHQPVVGADDDAGLTGPADDPGYDEPPEPGPFDASGDEAAAPIAFGDSAELWSDEQHQDEALEPDAARAAEPWAEPAGMDEAEPSDDAVTTSVSPWETQEAPVAAEAEWDEPAAEYAAEYAAELEPAAEPLWAAPAGDEGTSWTPTAPEEARDDEEPAWAEDAVSAPTPDAEDEALADDAEPRDEWGEPVAAPADQDAWAAAEPASPWGATSEPERTSPDSAEWDRGETWVDAPLPPDEEEPVSELAAPAAISAYDEPEQMMPESMEDDEPEEPAADHAADLAAEAPEPTARWRDDDDEQAITVAEDDDADRAVAAVDEAPDELAPEADVDTAVDVAGAEAELPAPAASGFAWASGADADPVTDDEPVDETVPESFVPASVVPAPAVAAPVAVAAAAIPAALSDADIDRIARRVLELAGDIIERIAWEVIPDMAEVVVRERVRAIEERMGRDDSVQ